MPGPVSEVLDAERRAKIGYMPTSRVMGGLADLFDPTVLDELHLAQALPSDLLAWYRTDEGQWFVKEMTRDFDDLPAERIRRVFASRLERQRALAYVALRGGRILFGSDTPFAPTYANPPGYNGYLELREMEAAGVSPRQILAAATLENARFFRVENRYGTIPTAPAMRGIAISHRAVEKSRIRWQRSIAWCSVGKRCIGQRRRAKALPHCVQIGGRTESHHRPLTRHVGGVAIE